MGAFEKGLQPRLPVADEPWLKPFAAVPDFAGLKPGASTATLTTIHWFMMKP
jgi:hypothetical protein